MIKTPQKILKIIFFMFIFSLLITFTIYAGGDGEGKSKGESQKFILTEGEYDLPIVKDELTMSLVVQDSLHSSFSLNDNRAIWQEIEKKTNVKIDWQAVYGGKDYTQAINLRVASGTDLPDIFETRGLNPVKLHQTGVTVETTDLIRKFAPNILRYVKEEKAIQAAMIAPDKRMYAAYPFTEMQNGKSNISASYYRIDWVKKLGFKEPVTVEDYYELLKAFREKDPNGNGKMDEVPHVMSALNGLGFYGVAFDLSIGNTCKGWVADKNGKIGYDYLNPRFKDHLAMLVKMYQVGIFTKSVTVKGNMRQQLLSTNRVGLQGGGLNNVEQRDRLISKAGVDLSEGGHYFAPPPQNKITGKREFSATNPTKSRWMMISRTCKHPDVAIRWLDYIWGSEEGQIYLNFGIKGKTYDIGKDGKPYYLDNILNNPAGHSPSTALFEYGCLSQVLAFKRDDAFRQMFRKNEKLYNMPDKAVKYPQRPLHLPAMLASPEDGEEYASIMADVDTYREEMYLKFIMGAEPLDNFDKYVERMEFLGIEKVIAIQQRKYDFLQSFKLE